jgi:hypothetical protein
MNFPEIAADCWMLVLDAGEELGPNQEG